MAGPPGEIPPLAKAFLSEDYAAVDPRLPGWLEELTKVGANQCWHKRSTFKAHLYHVYQILKMWGQDDAVTSCGLFHSAYSNSYVNLAIFKAEAEGRPRLCELVGEEAETLIHFFCVVPRHALIYDHLLKPLQARERGRQRERMN
ncbi:hypothetical protein FOA52_006124 [Chlamydomonas sp. UWO 241]|nr:hypothetical protein FOA52_006124 [Chlamydomonas sp. UWO 241]